jgi:peptidoglycan-N-acetylglucosamine deacetylase
MHPQVVGHRSRIVELEKLVAYMKTRPGVWFATAEQIAKYLKEQNPPT